MSARRLPSGIVAVCLLTINGCSRVPRRSSEALARDTAAAPATNPASDPITLPAGTSFRVRLANTLDTRRNRAGDRFTATLDEPLVDGSHVVVPKGTAFAGHVTRSKSSGRFKGRAVLAVKLDSFTLDNREYRIETSSPARVSKGHKKHHFKWIGGGSAAGAAIGAIAGGGKGALIGAGAGAGAGTIGSVITGKRQVRLPAETALRFTLESPVSLGG